MAREVARYAIQIARGRSADFTLYHEEDDGTAIDVTGDSFVIHYDVGEGVETWTGEITDAEAGAVRFFMSAGATSSLDLGTGSFSFFWTRADEDESVGGFDGSFAVLETVRP